MKKIILLAVLLIGGYQTYTSVAAKNALADTFHYTAYSSEFDFQVDFPKAPKVIQNNVYNPQKGDMMMEIQGVNYKGNSFSVIAMRCLEPNDAWYQQTARDMLNEFTQETYSALESVEDLTIVSEEVIEKHGFPGFEVKAQFSNFNAQLSLLRNGDEAYLLMATGKGDFDKYSKYFLDSFKPI